VDNTENIISFCTGYGGIEIGLKLAGVNVRTVAACEIETYAVANLVAKMEEGALEPYPVWTDLKTFPSEQFRGKIHGITGGYPCQPFSYAGKRKGTDDPRHLWPFIREHVRTIRPVWCFFENVAGHLNLGFDEVLKDLRDLHYSVEAGLFTAAEVGATHKRQRLFILAVAAGQQGRGHAKRWYSNPETRSAGETELGDIRRIRQAERQEQPAGIEQSGELVNPQNPDRRTGEPTEQDQSGSRGNRPANAGSGTILANPDRDRNGQNAGRNGEAEGVSGEHRQEVCRGESAGAGEQLDDAPKQRIQRNGSEGKQEPETHAGQALSLCGRGRWPARPGQKQYDWEEPRTVEFGVCKLFDGDSGILDEFIFDVTKTALYNAVLGVKRNEEIAKTMFLLSKTIGTETIQWQVGRLWHFFTQEILRYGLFCKEQNKRGCQKIDIAEEGKQAEEEELPVVWNCGKITNTPRKRKHFRQLKKELDDIMRILPRKMALGEWKEGCEKIKTNMLSMRKNMPYSPWNVSGSLSKSEEIWRSASNEEVGQWVLGAYERYIYWQKSCEITQIRVDQLRLLGNGVVPQCVAKAWTELWKTMS
jgi:DNA (cytosine-5)-methyltransferase 1